MSLLFNSVGQYSTSLYETARGILRSRTKQAERADQLAQQNAVLKERCEQLNNQLEQSHQTIDSIKQQLRKAEHDNELLRSQPCRLPDDPRVPNHTYGPKLMSLCVNLAKTVGFRASEAALKIVFDWFQIKATVPCWTTIRLWMCRVGVAQLDSDAQSCEDMIWMVDHSNQIGKEKVLT